MQFTVRRTSVWGDEQPCEEARPITYARSDTWQGYPEKIDGWAIDINTLDDLMAFSKKYGDLVLRRDLWNYELPCIEIYDGYRE